MSDITETSIILGPVQPLYTGILRLSEDLVTISRLLSNFKSNTYPPVGLIPVISSDIDNLREYFNALSIVNPAPNGGTVDSMKRVLSQINANLSTVMMKIPTPLFSQLFSGGAKLRTYVANMTWDSLVAAIAAVDSSAGTGLMDLTTKYFNDKSLWMPTEQPFSANPIGYGLDRYFQNLMERAIFFVTRMSPNAPVTGNAGVITVGAMSWVNPLNSVGAVGAGYTNAVNGAPAVAGDYRFDTALALFQGIKVGTPAANALIFSLNYADSVAIAPSYLPYIWGMFYSTVKIGTLNIATAFTVNVTYTVNGVDTITTYSSNNGIVNISLSVPATRTRLLVEVFAAIPNANVYQWTVTTNNLDYTIPGGVSLNMDINYVARNGNATVTNNTEWGSLIGNVVTTSSNVFPSLGDAISPYINEYEPDYASVMGAILATVDGTNLATQLITILGASVPINIQRSFIRSPALWLMAGFYPNGASPLAYMKFINQLLFWLYNVSARYVCDGTFRDLVNTNLGG